MALDRVGRRLCHDRPPADHGPRHGPDNHYHPGPHLEYGHDDGCSITGGHVYRGAAVPELTGHYFYGDWCGGWVRSFRYEEGVVKDEMDWSEDLAGVGQPNAFGLDQAGELYVASYAGDVFKIVPVR